ncbi:MAG: hypothetical protein QNJ53_08680 [Pleurocapsa sp. MO_192.B19]|nr:hypothetical protein [Pleurocapsa sp. MO_192.B19]
MIFRLENYSQRVFPPIQPDIYTTDDELTALTPDEQVTRKLIALANKEFTRWEVLVGWKLDVPSQIGHLLLQHKMAIEAELEGKWQRADFFWQQVQIEIKALSRKDNVWQYLVSVYAKEQGVLFRGDPVQMRQRLVDELLIDTHCAFYNGRSQQIEKLTLGDRAFVHIDYIQKLLDLSALSDNSLLSVLGEPWEKRITLLKEANKWQQAIQCCQERLRYFPNRSDFQNELAEIHWLATLAKLREAKSSAHHRQNAKTLQAGIKALENCWQQHPYNLSIFEFLGSLYHLQAISLVNSEQFAEALVSIQKAVTYNPYLDKAFETRDEIVQVMTQLQEQMRQLQQEIARKFNARLNEEGQRLLTEVQKGFGPMNAYIESEQAKMTAEQFQMAQAVHLWQAIGLPEPPEGWQKEAQTVVMQGIDEQTVPLESSMSWCRKALQLCEEVDKVLQQPPASQADIRDVWQSIVANKPDLADLDSSLICTFLERKLFGEEGEGDRVEVTPPSDLSREQPILTPISVKRQPGAEPLLPWLFSPQDKRIKLQAIVAIALVLGAGGLRIQDRLRSSARETAYQEILAAEQIQDDLGLVQNAEVFFANSPLSGKDGRNDQVMELYTESLVRWYAQQEISPDASARKHLERYHQVMETFKVEDKQL